MHGATEPYHEYGRGGRGTRPLLGGFLKLRRIANFYKDFIALANTRPPPRQACLSVARVSAAEGAARAASTSCRGGANRGQTRCIVIHSDGWDSILNQNEQPHAEPANNYGTDTDMLSIALARGGTFDGIIERTFRNGVNEGDIDLVEFVASSRERHGLTS